MKYHLIVSLSLGAAAPALSGIFDIFQPTNANTAAHAVIEDPHPIRGLPDHLIPKYQQELFVCDNGQTVLKPSSVNDGYCDCLDQSDEPGTSACSRGVFYCRNKGYKLLAIPSSRVDDGICDCCDGTDEIGTCANTCKLAADRERAALDHMLTAYKSGRAQRQQLVQQVKQQLETQAAQHPYLQKEMDSVRNQQTAVQKSMDERAAALNQERQGALATNKATLDSLLLLEPSSVAYMAHFVYNLCDVLDLSRDQINDLLSFQPPATDNTHHEHEEAYTTEEGDVIEDVEFPIVANEQECDITDLTSSPLLSSLCTSPQGSLAELHHVFFQILKTYRPYSEVFFLLGHYHLQQQQWHDTATDFARNAVLTSSSDSVSSEAATGTCPVEFATLPSAFCTLKEDMQRLLEPIVKSESDNNQDPVYLQLKQDLSALQTSLRDLERRFSEATIAHNSLQEANSEDTTLALQALKNQCFDVVDGKFSYSLCVLQRVTQREESGSHNSVTLGEYNSVSVDNTNGSKTQITMHFTNGQHCWNHGARKADVTLQCGATNRLLSASEPATCAYALVFETPVACTETFAQQEGLVPYL